MPELPEVEQFRQLLLPLVKSNKVEIAAVGDNHRIKLTADDLAQVYSCTDVLRQGKQLCVVLTTEEKKTKYLYLHMGMTGRIRVEGRAENWGGKKLNGDVVQTDIKAAVPDESFPPMYTYLVFTSNNNFTAYFCDPRKFGSSYLADDLSDLEALAPDALTCQDPAVIENRILPALTNQRLGIKAVILDQKRAVSGVGNWVADEVLYQCSMHPDQTQLNMEEASMLWKTLQKVVTVAANALKNDTHYPEIWLFNYRWTKKKATKDAHGRTVTFLTSGGRTSAIVPSNQTLYARKAATKTAVSTTKAKIIRTQTFTPEPASSKAPANRGRKRRLDRPQHERDGTTLGQGSDVDVAKVEDAEFSNTVTAKRRRNPRLRN